MASRPQARLGAVLTSHASVVAPAALVTEVAGAAAVAGVAVGTAGATVFMKTLALVVSAIAVVSMGGLVYQTRRMQRAENEAAVAAKERDALAAKLSVVQARADKSERALQARAATAPAAKAVATPPTKASGAGVRYLSLPVSATSSSSAVATV